MDETLSELVSRSLDGDLSDTERAAFDRRLAEDHDLAAEFESMQQLRRAVSRVAGEMEPPAALDAVMKPLRLSPPAPPRHVRPAFRWLGAAAALVLGVTVTLEVARHNPTPTVSSKARPRVINHDAREIFELAPLPSAVPGSSRPLGAADRLGEEKPAPPEVEEPRALEIIGPLSEEEHTEIAGSDPFPKEEKVAEDQTPPLSTPVVAAVKTDQDIGRTPAPEAAGVAQEHRGRPAPGRVREKAASGKTLAATAGSALRDEAGPAVPARTIPAAVSIAGVEVWAGWSSRCAESGWEVVLGVQNGVVIAIERDFDGPAPDAGDECRLVDLVGAHLVGVPDGRHIAEVVLK